MSWMWKLWIVALLVACTGVEPDLAEDIAVEIAPSKEEPVQEVDPCVNPPPHECCQAVTPECNQCRAAYESYIRSCPTAVDKRIRVPVETDMEWVGKTEKKVDELDKTDLVTEDMPAGVHFRGDAELNGKTFLTCEELSDALCCRGESPDCISCRLKARNVVASCKSNGQGGIPIIHSPVGIPGQIREPGKKAEKRWGTSKPPSLQ